MKSSLIIGLLSLILGGALAYIQYNGSNDPFLTFTLIIGILIGAGLGLIFGAAGGYNSKAQSVKRKAKAQAQQQAMNSKIEDQSSGSSQS